MYSALKRRQEVTAKESGEDAPGKRELRIHIAHLIVAVSLQQGYLHFNLRCSAGPFLQTRRYANCFTCAFPVNPYQYPMRMVYLVSIIQMRKPRLRTS